MYLPLLFWSWNSRGSESKNARQGIKTKQKEQKMKIKLTPSESKNARQGIKT